MPKKRKTNKKDRLRQYEILVGKLRMATRIVLSQKLSIEAVNELVDLNRKFESEDDYYGH